MIDFFATYNGTVNVILGALISIVTTLVFNWINSRKKRKKINKALNNEITNFLRSYKSIYMKLNDHVEKNPGLAIDKIPFLEIFRPLKYLDKSITYCQNKDIILEFKDSHVMMIFSFFSLFDELQAQYLSCEKKVETYDYSYIEYDVIEKLNSDLLKIINLADEILYGDSTFFRFYLQIYP